MSRLGLLTFTPTCMQERASEEVAKLAKVPVAPDYIAAQTIAWVESHPDDPRAAEALHLTVHATRYGCADAETGRYSKQAFQLLHRRYPNSEWARKTKYWYGTQR